MQSTANTKQVAIGHIALPCRIPKRKAVTEADILKPAKRLKNTTNKSTLIDEWQRDQQKARDQVSIRPDPLKDIIVPPHALPRAIHSKWGGKTTYDENRTRKWAMLNASKTHVKNNMRARKDVRTPALASFPLVEARKEEERQDMVKARGVLREEVKWRIERSRQRVEGAKQSPGSNSTELLRWEFLYQCWKELNYALRFQIGPLEHRDMRSYGQEFAKMWANKRNKFWRPKWRKDKERGWLVIEWIYHRV